MPRVKNCSDQTYAVWGKKETDDGMIDGPEEYLDSLAPGGIGDFPQHGQLVIRQGDGAKRGPRVAGPFEDAEFYVGQDGENGIGARCAVPAAPRRPDATAWVLGGVGLVLILVLVGIILAIALRRI